MKILILNGPNLNMLGRREQAVYGTEKMERILEQLKQRYPDTTIDYFQSNGEGEIVTRIQQLADEDYQGLVINAGAYTHYSYAIHDALLILQILKVEVHMSNIYMREEFRRKSVLSGACDGIIAGFGKESYRLALDYIIHNQRPKVGFNK